MAHKTPAKIWTLELSLTNPATGDKSTHAVDINIGALTATNQPIKRLAAQDVVTRRMQEAVEACYRDLTTKPEEQVA